MGLGDILNNTELIYSLIIKFKYNKFIHLIFKFILYSNIRHHSIILLLNVVIRLSYFSALILPIDQNLTFQIPRVSLFDNVFSNGSLIFLFHHSS